MSKKITNQDLAKQIQGIAKQNKDLTQRINKLSKDQDQGFKKVWREFGAIKELIDEKIDALALATKAGFDHMDEQFAEVRADISSLQNDVSSLQGDVSLLKTDVSSLQNDSGSLKSTTESLKTDIELLKRGQHAIWQRLDNVPYRFEHEKLENRVTTLEKEYFGKSRSK